MAHSQERLRCELSHGGPDINGLAPERAFGSHRAQGPLLLCRFASLSDV